MLSSGTCTTTESNKAVQMSDHGLCKLLNISDWPSDCKISPRRSNDQDRVVSEPKICKGDSEFAILHSDMNTVRHRTLSTALPGNSHSQNIHPSAKSVIDVSTYLTNPLG